MKDNIACLYGLKDDAGNWVVPANYIEIRGGYNNRFTVKQGEKWGLINQDGKIIIPLLYDEIRGADYNFQNAYIVAQGKNFGLLNKNGKIILKPIYDKIEPLNYYFKILEKTVYGLADTTGIIIKPAYNYLEIDNHRKIIKVISQTKIATNRFIYKTGFINFKNDTLIPLEYDAIWYTDQGGLMLGKNNRYCYIDQNKDTIFKPGARIITDYNRDGKMQIQPSDTIAVSYGNKWGLCTGQGKWITDTIYNDISIIYGRPTHESNLFWEISVNGKMGYLSHAGKVIIPALYDNLRVFSWNYLTNNDSYNENYIIIAENNGDAGLLLPTGDTLLPLKYTLLNFATSLLYFSNETEIYSLRISDFHGNNQEKPILTKLTFFASLDNDYVILKELDRFVFAEYHKNAEKPRYSPDYNNYGEKIKLKKRVYEVNYNYKTYYFDLKGNPAVDPFAGKEIVKEIGYNFLYRDKTGWNGYADSMGKNLLDTVYSSIIYSENGLWVKQKTDNDCRFGKTIEDYPYTYNYCACNWTRYNFNGKRTDKYIYDLPTTKSNVVYIEGKAGLYDFRNERFLIKPKYTNLVPQYGGNLYAGTKDDSSFTIHFKDGRLLSNQDWKLMTPITIRNPELNRKLNSKGYYGYWFLILENEEERIMMDLTGKFVKKEKDITEIINNSIKPSKNYTHNWNTYSPIENAGPQIYFHNNHDQSFSKEEFEFLKNYIFNTYQYRYSKFPEGSYLNSDACNVYIGNDTRIFSDLWGVHYADKEIFSVEVAFDADTSEYHDQVSYFNFVKNGNGFSKITIESLFKDSINVPAILNECILADLATRDDLNLDCNNPTSYYSQTHGRFMVSDKGLHLFNYGIVQFTTIIPWKNLIPYAKEGGVIEYFMKGKIR